MKRILLILISIACSISCKAQSDTPLKIHHAEPLYMDLIRDLGARKGEKEWNMGWGINDQKSVISYSGFAEYEFSPLNRLGLEVEIPFSFYQTVDAENKSDEAKHRIEGLKTAIQYTFWVSSRYRLSMAAGYVNELKFHSFTTMFDRQHVIKGNVYSPFFIVAKRWGGNFHSLIYTGPVWEQEFETHVLKTRFQFNASIHYVIPGTSHFVGIEWNQEFGKHYSESVMRPQAKVKIASGLYLGVLTGIPLSFENQRMSFMMRVIYEPGKN